MPANVETMFSVKQTPWHGLGAVIAAAPTIQEGIGLAGLDWSVIVASLKPFNKEAAIANLNMEYESDVDTHAKAFIRSDNMKVLGVVGPKTFPLQNKHAFDFFQPFVDSGEASLETAGSLDEGRVVWVMAKINRDDSTIVKGDDITKFVLLSNSHDGTLAVRVGFTPIRVVCANTLSMAHHDKASKLIRVRHSKQVKENVDAIRDIINVANESFEATAEQYRFLASRHINVSDLNRYVKLVLQLDEEKMTTRSKNILTSIMDRHEASTGMAKFMLAQAEKIVENFEAGRGTDNAPSRGTYWTAYNAFNEYLNYEKGHNPDTRMNSLWFGPNAVVNTRALDIATRLAKGETVE